jgi:hypothetical protein
MHHNGACVMWSQDAVFTCGQMLIGLQRYIIQSAKGNVK